MRNTSIREEIRSEGLCQWQVAKAIGIHEKTLCVWLRDELSGEKEKIVRDAIEQLRSEKKGGK